MQYCDFFFFCHPSTWIKREINSNTIIVGDFKTPLTPVDRSTKQKISKETQALNDTMDQLDLIYIYKAFHPKILDFTFFSSAHGTFSKTDHILGQKCSLGKFLKIEIISSFFFWSQCTYQLQGKKTIKNKHMETTQHASE